MFPFIGCQSQNVANNVLPLVLSAPGRRAPQLGNQTTSTDLKTNCLSNSMLPYMFIFLIWLQYVWLPQCRIYVYTNGSILRVIPQGCVFIYPQMSKLSCFVYTLQIWRIQRCKCLFVRLWLSLMSSRHCSPYLIVFKHLTRNLASERTGKESKMKWSEH